MRTRRHPEVRTRPEPRTKAPAKAARPAITRRDFIGAQMSNFLHAIRQDPDVPFHFRDIAADLQEKWDSVAVFRLDNPLVAAELQEKFGEMKP
jgi:hypothetical protein